MNSVLKNKYKTYGTCKDCGKGVIRKETERCCMCSAKFRTTPTSQRFLKRVKKTDTCWIWTGGKNAGGYGIFLKDGKCNLAHRYMFELKKSPIPLKLLVCHSCDNPPCVNPDHLWLGTHFENTIDSVKKGRWAFFHK